MIFTSACSPIRTQLHVSILTTSPDRGRKGLNIAQRIMALHREVITDSLSQVDLGLCSITAVPSLITDAYFAPVSFQFTFFLVFLSSACKSFVAGLGHPVDSEVSTGQAPIKGLHLLLHFPSRLPISDDTFGLNYQNPGSP